ncbi:MAG TPA: DUF2157 domain-containing protein [Phenylobacterium sp.]|nr:DUF2157 domain-containing protein [Phenylobacterium sp.]
MAGYKARLEQDLDGWIAKGLVPEASREPILAGVAEPRRLEASSALAAVGGLLLGVAVIAFVAANWSGIPRLGRFGLILGLFLAVCGGAAWAGERRPLARNIALLVAALIYAAAIGLTGQIFDIAGDPRSALHAAGLAAILLALAGRSSGSAIAALALIAIADGKFDGVGGGQPPPWLALAAPLGVGLGWAWRSKPLVHAASLALAVAGLLVLVWLKTNWPMNLDAFAAALGFALLAGGARYLDERDDPVAGVAYGWWVWAALAFFAAAGFGPHPPEALLHRPLWLAAAAGVIALGLHDRRGVVTAAGVAFMAGAVAAILADLGLGLMTAAAVFAAVALIAFAGGFALRRRVRR